MKDDAFDVVSEWFIAMGYKVLAKPDPQDNNCDMFVVGKKKAAKVEIKRVRRQKNGGWQSDPVSKNQLKCDLLAFVLPSGSVCVESMDAHLSQSSEGGYRQFNHLKLD
jgi:hypothetical protein